MSALAVLEEIHRADPETDRISLRGLELNRLDEPTLAFLQQKFPSIRHLDVRDNALTQAPCDLGSFVPALVTLDIRNNPLASIPELSEALVTCTSLQCLYVTLHNKTDEKVLRVMLPRLRLLNGNPVSVDDDSNKRPSPLSLDWASSPTSVGSLSSLDSHSPSHRWLDTPPSTTASAVRPVRSPQEKRELRIHFAAAKAKKPTITTRPKLSPRRLVQSVKPTELPATISDEKTDWRKLLKQTTAARESKQQGESQGKTLDAPSHITPSDALTTRSFIAELKSIIRAFQKPPAKGSAHSADHELVVEQLERKIDLLASQLHDLETSPPAAAGTDPSQDEGITASLAARWRLVEAGTLYASHRVGNIDKNLGAGINRLLHTQTQVVEALLGHVNDAIRAQKKWHHANASQQHVADQQKQQMKLLLDVAETLEHDLEALQAKYEQEKTQREQAQATSESLLNECDGLKQQLTHQQQSNEQAPVTAQPQRRIRKRQERTRKETKTWPTVSPKADTVARSTSPPRSPPTNPPVVRSLTLKQLVDLIHCILTSKSKYDARIAAIGAPPETVEQHLYTYLNQRFGLPSLTIEYAAAIWRGCQAYTRQDNDVAMFHALLRNQVDEEFVGIKKKLQQAIRELLRAYFLAKHPLKTESVIQKLVDTRLHGGMIWEDEWTELLLYLYDPSDSSILMRLVKRKADVYQRQHDSGGRSTSATPPASVPFAVFEKLLYDYQLQGRLKLLEHFRLVFSEVDSDHVGVLTQQMFRDLVARVAPRKSDAELHKMLDRMDPCGHDSITFSDAVRCLLPDIRQNSINRRTATTAAVNKCTTRTRN